jgi:predicted Zn-dependent protease
VPRREQLQAMLHAEPDDVFLNYALAKALVEEGRADDALAQFRRTLRLDPDHVASYFQMAQVLAAEGNPDEARTVVSQGIDVARKVGDAHAEMEMTGFRESL